MPSISKQLLQAYQMQDLAFNAAMSLKEEMEVDGKLVVRRDEYGKPVDAPAIAQLMQAWERAQQRISFHRRVPAPGVLKPEESKKVKRLRSPGGPGVLIDVTPQVQVTAPASEPPKA